MKIDEIEKYRTKDREPLIYLQSLLNGSSLQIGDYKYCLAETETGGCQLVMITDDNHVLGSDMTIGDFITYAIKNKENVFLAVANNVLNEGK